MSLLELLNESRICANPVSFVTGTDVSLLGGLTPKKRKPDTRGMGAM
jgi:hypothetical protein